MKIKVITGHTRIAQGAARPLDVLVKLTAPAGARSARRPPVAVIPVLDVSGSMEGAKLEAAKDALLRLLDHLGPGDHIGLITFSSEARVVQPLVELTEARRRTIRARILALDVESNTNLAAALQTAAELVTEARLPAAVRPRVIVLTDGHANEGPAVEAASIAALLAARAGSLTLSAFGYGDDCDHDLLGALAEARGGSFACIRNPDVVLTAFARELGGLMATYAASVRVTVAAEGAAAATTVALGDLMYGGELRHHARLEVTADAAADAVVVGNVTVQWTAGDGEPAAAAARVHVAVGRPGCDEGPEDAEVARARDEHLLERAQATAEQRARDGDHAGALRAIDGAIGVMREADLIVFACDHLRPCYVDQAAHRRAAPLRASARAALKKNRQVVACGPVAEAFALVPSAQEVAMEESFGKRRRR